MKRRIVFLSLVFLFILSVSAPAATLEEIQARGYLRVGLHLGLAPFNFYDQESRKVVGFDIDLINAVAKMWNVKVNHTIKEWPELIPAINNREFDVIVAPMTITTERAQSVAFTLPHFNAGQTVIVRSDEESIKSHLDIKGRRAAASKGSTCAEAGQSVGAVVVAVRNKSVGTELLLKGEVDAQIADRPIALTIVKESAGKLKIVGEPFTKEYYGYAVNKEDTELLMQLNQSLTILQGDGSYDVLIERWFSSK